MSAFSAARRMGRLPHQFFADLVAATEARRQAGHDVINLGQGNPIDPTPTHIVDTLALAAANPVYQRYIPFQGLSALKEAGARWWQRRHGVILDPAREIAVLIGVKVGLAEISLVVLNPGDKAAVPDPGYPDYWSGIALAGGVCHPMALTPRNQYYPDWSLVPEDTRLVFLNYPHNPTGQVARQDVFQEAVTFAQRTGAVMAHDLAYGDIRFDPDPSSGSGSFLATPGAKAVGVEFLSLSKSYNMAGWRIGLVAGQPDIIHEIEVLQDHLHCSQFGAIQEAAIAALESPAALTEAMAHRYRERRDIFLHAVATAGWNVPAPRGGIFCWAPAPAGLDGQALAQILLEKADVMVAPGIGFGEQGRHFVRISLTQPTERLAEAGARIAQVWAEVSSPGAPPCIRTPRA